MIHYIYTIRDSAAEVYHPPFCVRAPGQATRDFAQQVNTNREGNPLYAHPSDFELYSLGTYNDSDGMFNPQAPKLVMRGKDARKEEQQQ